MTRICFLNPFGTDDYDALIAETEADDALTLLEGRRPEVAG